MSLNDTVSAERVHIGFFGLRNAGKSSLVNAVTGQSLSLVSDVKGTTTDPVKKAMEILPLGPVVIIDTPGLDDEGELGLKRVEKAKEVLDKIHIGVLTVDASKGLSDTDRELIELFADKKIPYIVAFNKADLVKKKPQKENEIFVSAKTNENIDELKEKLASLLKLSKEDKKILADIVNSGDTVVMVIPIDESAPKGRIILPQQQTLREILDIGATAVICKDSELKATLDRLKNKPDLVITDSQVFKEVAAILPMDVPLTSFSILFARYKGDLELVVKGADALANLKDGDTLLISEGCTHHRQCKDIGTVKLPGLIKKYTGKELSFRFTQGGEFPKDFKDIALAVHCGGCMLSEVEMQARLKRLTNNDLPVTNYGIAIAKITGILERSIAPFKMK